MTNSERQVVRRFDATWAGGPVMNPYTCYGLVVFAHEYDALLSQVERMRPYLQHKPNCAAIADFRADEACTCGLAELLKDIK